MSNSRYVTRNGKTFKVITLNPEPADKKDSNSVGEKPRHIGCPLSWFNLVFPIVRGKNELAVALFLYRLRSIKHKRTVSVTNTNLLSELKINRFAKYRALKRLEDAGIITVERHHYQALKITFHDDRRPKTCSVRAQGV